MIFSIYVCSFREPYIQLVSVYITHTHKVYKKENILIINMLNKQREITMYIKRPCSVLWLKLSSQLPWSKHKRQPNVLIFSFAIVNPFLYLFFPSF